MRVKTKIIMNVSAIISVGVIVTAVILTMTAENRASEALSEQVQQRLIGLRDAKSEQIQDYFTTIEKQIVTQASSDMAVEAMQAFNLAYKTYRSDLKSNSAQTIDTSITGYYEDQFLSAYRENNSGRTTNVDSLINQLSPEGKLLQFSYISNNTNPLGSKDALLETKDGSNYDRAHFRFHPSYRSFLQAFGFYDIFLVDSKTGVILYSVFKELDFGTSLMTGAYADSGIGEAFAGAKNMKVGEVNMVDFKPYTPSYEAPAAFFATPIYKGSRQLGVLIFQAPVDRINEVMTYQGQWRERGLGNSGETYLVGPDHLMRSQSRFLVDDKPAFLTSLENARVEPTIIEEIDQRGSSLGIFPVRTDSVDRALSGETGYDVIEDYRGIPVASAFTSFSFGDNRWAIISEIDEAEAFAAKDQMVQQMVWAAGGLTLLIILAGWLASWVLGGYLSKPIEMLNDFVVSVAESLDLSRRADVRTDKATNDEIGKVGRSFNQMMDSIHDAMKQVSESSNNLNDSVNSLRSNFDVVADQSNEQYEMTLQLSTAIEEMAQTSDSLAQSAEQSNVATQDAVKETQTGKSNIEQNSVTNQALQDTIGETASNVAQVAKDIENIGTVLDVIRGIAEQTNLLALNAAIEAARAGEQGRGFAVVADEVRSLAQKTQDSTQEIQNIIETLQRGAQSTVSTMDAASERVTDSVETTHLVSASFENIDNQVHAIEGQNSQVATAATQQSSVARDMSNQVAKISDLATQNNGSVHEASGCCNSVESEYQRLQTLVNQFKL